MYGMPSDPHPIVCVYKVVFCFLYALLKKKHLDEENVENKDKENKTYFGILDI